MNEELRQDSVVRFCEALTKRVREALDILGGMFSLDANEVIYNADHNIIRVKCRRTKGDDWIYSFTLDDGSECHFHVENRTAIAVYRNERFRLHVYQVEEMYVNGDIHYSKHEIDYHPSGLSTTIDPRLSQSLVNAKSWDDFDAILNSKVRWLTQVNRKEWAPSVIVQRGFDQDLELVAIAAYPKHSDQSVEWHFEWDNGNTTKGYQDTSTTEGRNLYQKLTKQLVECNPTGEWRAAFLSNVTAAEG